MKKNRAGVYASAACGALIAFQAHGVNLEARFEVSTDRSRGPQKNSEVFKSGSAGSFGQEPAAGAGNSRLPALIASAVGSAARGEWDGEGALQVSEDVVMHAHDLASLLPSDMPDPDVYITDAGSISFDWDKTAKAQLSIMILAAGGIAFASYLRGNRAHGAFAFDDTGRLPEEIGLAIQKWKAFDSARPGAIGPRAI